MPESILNKIEQEVAQCPYLVHAKNLLTRYERRDKLDVLEKILPAYEKYYDANRIIGYDASTIESRVKALNEYYDYLHDNGLDSNSIYSAQTKFRPSILEEFLALVFRDFLLEVKSNIPAPRLNLGSVKAYTNLYFYGKDFPSFAKCPMIGVNLKDQDFAIFRDVSIKMDEGCDILASLPLVAVECKTFIDKTMLEGSVATADKLKSGNPYAYFCIVSELYDVSMEVNPAYSRIDQIYILRKTTRRGVRREICSSVVVQLVNDVIKHLKKPWSDVGAKLSGSGLLI